MIVKNKKNGTNVLAFRDGLQNVRISIKAGEQINIAHLIDFNQIINKADFGNRGWFDIISETKIVVESKKEITEEKKETDFDKAIKEVKKYTSEITKEEK